MSKKIFLIAFFPALTLGISMTPPLAQAFWFSGKTVDIPIIKLAIKGRSFLPKEIMAPAGKKFKLIISNENKEPSEFESFTLHREQVVVGNGHILVFLGPLKAGSYGFFDDFHSGVTGTIKAVADMVNK